ncbi:MAG: AraC family transcriptional regulator [Clostridiales bacterium]|nr:AraC family transcriptional regulator [Clostridiales bacterium]
MISMQFNSYVITLLGYLHSNNIHRIHLESFSDGAAPIGMTTHNYATGHLEYLAIDVPWLIMHESMDLTRNISCLTTFSPKGVQASSIDFDKLHTENRALHFHDFYELTCVLSGSFRMQIDDTFRTYRTGECTFCNKKVWHAERFDRDCELMILLIQEDFLSSVLRMDESALSERPADRPSSLFRTLLNGDQASPFMLKKIYYDFAFKPPIDTCLNQLAYYFFLIVRELSQGTVPPGTSYFISGSFRRIFFLLENEEVTTITMHQLETSGNELLFFEVDQLFNECHGQISRQEIEDKTHYNSEYLNRVVKKYTGMTLNEYKKSFLMKESARLLAETDTTVEEVCRMLGYTNRTYFNKLFTKTYGVSPGQFRKSHHSH